MLRAKRLAEWKFKRQEQIGNYIVDFVCFKARLVVEADGSQHADSAGDAQRDAYLTRQGFRVLRFWNNDVLTNSDGVGTAILAALETPLPNPSPARGEGLKGNMTPYSSSRLAEFGERGGGAPNG
jgi:very-short-patch-repair endonuclease